MKFTILATIATSAAAFTSPKTAFTARSSALDASIVDTLAGLEGPGQVWGAEGIALGHEESDLRGYDNFGTFVQRLQSSGVAATLAGAGPFTVFAPTDLAIQSYELTRGPFDADAIGLCIVQGTIPSSAVGSAPLTTIAGESLTYSRKFRKDFVNDSIIGEKTFGNFADFPIDVACDNGVIHSVGQCIERL
mmetsp:Transcript_31817/g.37095  ORF Transcript_31817/g.37095 Transcript_31817/m.37095 type:complete len:191 (+) Transcript_31817:73-645(+)